MSWLSDFYRTHPAYRRLRVARRDNLYVAEAELPQDLAPRGARGFMPSFGAPFARPFASAGGAKVNWWDAGGWPATSTYWVYQAKSGNGVTVASLAASYVNLASPGTNDLTAGVAPTWAAATGWTSDGTKYLISTIVAGSGWSAIVQLSGIVGGPNTEAFGSRDGTRYFGIVPRGGADVVYYENGGYTSVAPGLVLGNLAIAGQNGYRNGALDTAIIPEWLGTNVVATYVLRQNGQASGVVGTVIALIICDKTLTAPMVAAKAAQMALI